MIRGRATGFTLVEMLVVLVIIGVMIGGAVLAIGVAGRDRALETAADRLAALIEYAGEQAELQSRDLGLSFLADQYSFLSFDPVTAQWLEIRDDELRPRRLPDGLAFEVSLEGRRIVVAETATKLAPTPQIVIGASGELTPFAVTIRRTGTSSSILVETDDEGRVATGELQEQTP